MEFSYKKKPHLELDNIHALIISGMSINREEIAF